MRRARREEEVSLYRGGQRYPQPERGIFRHEID